MHLDIVTPEKKVFSGEVNLVQLPGSKGSFEILKNHAPIISTLDRGEVKVQKSDGEELFFSVEGGVVEFKMNVITILADN